MAAPLNVYLAGPMRGKPKFNFPAFAKAAKELREDGYTVFNPAERDVRKYGKKIMENPRGTIKKAAAQVGFSLREALASDTAWLCKTADAIALLPGWRKSKGAKAELALAKALGLKEIYLK